MNSGIALFFFISLIAVVVGAAFFARRSSIRLDGRCWEDLVAAFEPVNLKGVQCIAREFLQPTNGKSAVEPEIMWQVLGGEAGLRVMERNATLLLSLAAHMMEWNEEEASVMSERMRRDALKLRSAVRQIRFGMYSQLLTGRHWISVPFQLQEAASAYFLMRQRFMALLEVSHAGMLPALAQTI